MHSLIVTCKLLGVDVYTYIVVKSSSFMMVFIPHYERNPTPDAARSRLISC